PRIDPGTFTRASVKINVYFLAVGQKYLRNVSQVIFALFVRRLDAFECRKQFARVKAIDSGVYLPDLSFLECGVLLLHYAKELIVFFTNDAAVARRVFKPHAQNRARRLAGPVLVDQVSQSRRAN